MLCRTLMRARIDKEVPLTKNDWAHQASIKVHSCVCLENSLCLEEQRKALGTGARSEGEAREGVHACVHA